MVRIAVLREQLQATANVEALGYLDNSNSLQRNNTRLINDKLAAGFFVSLWFFMNANVTYEMQSYLP